MKSLVGVVMALMSLSLCAAEWTKGEVRRVDIENKKISIRHEEIKSLDMPPMSMVFYVENTGLLKGISPGDQVEFVADQTNTKLFVRDIKKVQ